MVHIRFEWNRWSTGPVTASIVGGSWALACAAVSLISRVAGHPGLADMAAAAAKGFCAVTVALLAFAAAAGVVVERLGTSAHPAQARPRIGR